MIVKENGFLYLKKTNVKRIIHFDNIPRFEKFKFELTKVFEMDSYNYDKDGSIYYHEPSLRSGPFCTIRGDRVYKDISFAAMYNLFVFFKPLDFLFGKHIRDPKHTICDMDLIKMGAKNLLHVYSEDLQSERTSSRHEHINVYDVLECGFQVLGNVYIYNPDSKYTDPIRRLLFYSKYYSGYDEFYDAVKDLDMDNNVDYEKYYFVLRKLRSSDLKIGAADNYQNNCIKTPLAFLYDYPYIHALRKGKVPFDLDYTKLPKLKKIFEKIEVEAKVKAKVKAAKYRIVQIEKEKIENENRIEEDNKRRKAEEKIRDYEQKLTKGEFPIKVKDLSIEWQKNLGDFIEHIKQKKNIEFDLKRKNNEAYLTSMKKCIEFIRVLLVFREEEHKYNREYHIKHKRDHNFDSLFYKITYNSINYTITIHHNVVDNQNNNKIWDHYMVRVEQYLQSLIVESYNNLPLGRYLDAVKELRKLSKDPF